MRFTVSWRLAGVALLLAAHTSVRAEDWPQWLGPRRDSVWRETGILTEFPADGPKVIWRAPLAHGYSGPVVAGGRVYVTDREKSEGGSKERVLCFKESDGTLVWKDEYPCQYSISYPAGPRVAPLAAGEHLYTLGAEGDLRCLKTSSGEMVWSRELKKDFNIKAPMWGFAGHPLLHGKNLICLVGGVGSTVVSFDKDTGKELWRALTAEEPGYSSPIVLDRNGKAQLVIFHPEAANSLDPVTGALLWSVPFKSNAGLSVATPRVENDLLFFTSFYNGSLMVALDSTGEHAKPLWQTEKANEVRTTHLNAILCTPFIEQDHIYGVCSYGQLRCLNAKTGERVWETFKATTSGEPVRWANAFIVKNGDRFFLFNEKGDLVIAKLSPKGYEEISRAHLLEPTNKDCGRLVVWSHPAFANGHCYARNDKELICVDLSTQ